MLAPATSKLGLFSRFTPASTPNSAAIARAQLVDPELRAVACDLPPRHGTDPNAEFFGVPTFIKDNTDVAGLPRELIQAGWDAFRFWRS